MQPECKATEETINSLWHAIIFQHGYPIMDTLGTVENVLISEVSSFQEEFEHI